MFFALANCLLYMFSDELEKYGSHFAKLVIDHLSAYKVFFFFNLFFLRLGDSNVQGVSGCRLQISVFTIWLIRLSFLNCLLWVSCIGRVGTSSQLY